MKFLNIKRHIGTVARKHVGFDMVGLKAKAKAWKAVLLVGVIIFLPSLGFYVTCVVFVEQHGIEAYHLGWVEKYGDRRVESPAHQVLKQGGGIKIVFTTDKPSQVISTIPMPIDFRVEATYLDGPDVGHSKLLYSAAEVRNGEFIWVADRNVSITFTVEKHQAGATWVVITLTYFPEYLHIFYYQPLSQLGAIFGVVLAITGAVALRLTREKVKTIACGERVTISGFISRRHRGIPVTISSSTDGISWKPLATVKTGYFGVYKHDWTPLTVGTHYFKAYWNGDNSYEAAESISTLTVEKASPAISVSCEPSMIALGDSTVISGLLVLSSFLAATDVQVTLSYSLDGSVWYEIQRLKVSTDGGYQCMWIPPAVGIYRIRVAYAGDANHNEVTQTCTLTVKKKLPSVISFSLFRYYHAKNHAKRALEVAELKRKIEAIDREVEQARRKLEERGETLAELKAETLEKVIELCKREGVPVIKGSVTGKREIHALGSSKELVGLAKASNRPVIWREREGDLLVQNGVTTHILSMRKEAAEAGERYPVSSMEERLQAYRAELDELYKLRGEGSISEETYAERKKVLEDKIASALLE